MHMNIYRGQPDRCRFAAALLQQQELGHQQVGRKGRVKRVIPAFAWPGSCRMLAEVYACA